MTGGGGGVEAMMTVGRRYEAVQLKEETTTTDSLFMRIGNKDTTIDSVVGTMIGSAATTYYYYFFSFHHHHIGYEDRGVGYDSYRGGGYGDIYNEEKEGEYQDDRGFHEQCSR